MFSRTRVRSALFSPIAEISELTGTCISCRVWTRSRCRQSWRASTDVVTTALPWTFHGHNTWILNASRTSIENTGITFTRRETTTVPSSSSCRLLDMYSQVTSSERYAPSAHIRVSSWLKHIRIVPRRSTDSQPRHLPARTTRPRACQCGPHHAALKHLHKAQGRQPA